MERVKFFMRVVVLVVAALLGVAAFLFANQWLELLGSSEDARKAAAALAALPFILALTVYKKYPAPGCGVGKEALSLGPIKLLAGATFPSVLQRDHAYCIVFWSISDRKPVNRVETLCRVFSSNAVHFLMLSVDGPAEDVEKFAKSVQVSKKPLTVKFAVDTTGAAVDNYMHQHGERGVPHAFVVGTDGVIAWHGHPNRPEFGRSVANIVKAMPARPKRAAGRDAVAGAAGSEARSKKKV